MALAWENSVPVSYRTEFLNKVILICNRLGIDPNWLMIVMYFESGGTFSASKKNPNSSAVGLIQFTTKGAVITGKTTAQLAAMTAVQQLDYVEIYLKPYKGKMTDVYKTYLAVFAPAYITSSDAQKVYVYPSESYTANRKLDTNQDGIISVGEIKAVIKRYIPTGYSSGANLITEAADNPVPVALLGIGALITYFLLKSNDE